MRYTKNAINYARFASEWLTEKGEDVNLSLSSCMNSEPDINLLITNLENVSALLKKLKKKKYILVSYKDGKILLKKNEDIIPK